MNKIDIIIPAYNEEHRISDTLSQYANFFSNNTQLTIVLNGCTDNTHEIVKLFQQDHPEIISIINIPEAIGKGAAIIEGWKKSTADIVGFVDADNATQPDEFEKLIKTIDGHDGVIASRFLPESQIINRQSTLRTIMSRAYILFVKLLFQLPYSDTQCGAKLFKRNVIQRILPELKHADMSFDVELLWKLKKAQTDIIEIPTIWVDKPGSAMLGSTGNFLKTGANMLAKLAKLRFF
ncbi:MAG: glycosyltransferase family 2 protein [bacterium]|nr:glycosyltransferase family 2 protein [bacterium]